MAKPTKGKPRKPKTPKKVTRYTHDDASDPRTPETGHAALMEAEQTVTLPMDNGWSEALAVEKLDRDQLVVVDLDPAFDPVFMWSGKSSRREVPVLPLQRNEVVSESRIARIVQRARAAAADAGGEVQGQLFAELEKALRESAKGKRVEFYTHDEGWKNKVICGDSLPVMESLIHYEGLRGKVQMVYVDPPYGIKYDSNFQQRVDSTRNDEKDQADDVLTIKAFRDTWSLGIHSYLSYLQERLYLCRELLGDSGVLFVQANDDNCHAVRSIAEEVFGKSNYVAQVIFRKTAGKSGALIDSTYDVLLCYAKSRPAFQGKYKQVYIERRPVDEEQYKWLEQPDGVVVQLSQAQLEGREPIPEGRRFLDDNLTSQGESSDRYSIEYEGRTYPSPRGRHWSVGSDGIARLTELGRLFPVGNWLKYKRYLNDMPVRPLTDQWLDTVMSTFSGEKVYVVQTPAKVLERCIAMSTEPGDLVFDPTAGSGTTAYVAERLGRRWITCDTSRVALNVARQRLLAAVFDHYRTRDGSPSSGFFYKAVGRVTMKSLAYDLEPESVELVDQPEVDRGAIRVCGPFEVMTLGRYSLEDWKGYMLGEHVDEGLLENYVSVISRLYRPDAALQESAGIIHAVVESEGGALAISVGPISGRVTAHQMHDAVRDAVGAGLGELHILGWAFEANVGEVKARLADEHGVRLELVMIRPDTLAEGLKITKPEMLFSPLALPEVEFSKADDGKLVASLQGVAVFDRKRRVTEYRKADSGYVSAWYLDED